MGPAVVVLLLSVGFLDTRAGRGLLETPSLEQCFDPRFDFRRVPSNVFYLNQEASTSDMSGFGMSCTTLEETTAGSARLPEFFKQLLRSRRINRAWELPWKA